MRKQWLKTLVAGMIIGASVMTGCTSASKSPDEDKKIADDTKDREAKLKDLSQENKQAPSKDQDPIAYKRALLDQILKDLKRYKELGVPPVRDPHTDEVIARVLFDYDKSNVKEEFQNQLNADAKFVLAELEQRGEMILEIEGHADERGTNEYNLALGKKRAHSVHETIKAQSAKSAELLKTHSYGEEQPAVEGKTEDAFSQNRRVQFTFLLKN